MPGVVTLRHAVVIRRRRMLLYPPSSRAPSSTRRCSLLHPPSSRAPSSARHRARRPPSGATPRARRCAPTERRSLPARPPVRARLPSFEPRCSPHGATAATPPMSRGATIAMPSADHCPARFASPPPLHSVGLLGAENAPALRAMDSYLKEKLVTWLSPAALMLHQITWDDPSSLL
ncbi:hypothetical protein PVAP13_8KG203403 [Panicum virgatum]|uniref:Uncharacterized protein n=1 Tax=Panicum virgatum TaxID=38727 RepID=A0A8T0PIJ4_PANVG|nr:hypothetical protein PVAP13_8KG203403 [Panicum virgatum]